MTRTPGITTKRKPLTKLQRATMFAAHGGICVICKLPIDEPKGWIDEHIRSLGLSGTNDMSNRGPAHLHCAEAKTKTEDMPRIVKAKAQQAADTSKDPDEKPAFGRKTEKQSKNIDPFPDLPPANLFRRYRSAP